MEHMQLCETHQLYIKSFVLWQDTHSVEVNPSMLMVRILPYTGFVPFFRHKFPGLFQDSDWFFQDSKIHINLFTPKISMLILLTVCQTIHIFYLSLTDFQNFPAPVALLQDLLEMLTNGWSGFDFSSLWDNMDVGKDLKQN